MQKTVLPLTQSQRTNLLGFILIFSLVMVIMLYPSLSWSADMFPNLKGSVKDNVSTGSSIDYVLHVLLAAVSVLLAAQQRNLWSGATLFTGCELFYYFIQQNYISV